MTPLPIPENLLRELLTACTTEAPFRTHRNEIFKQINGVSMGSPLGVLFAEMYMARVEERTFGKISRPKLYVRYRDDIFTIVNKTHEIDGLAMALEENSVLKFTIERSQNNCLPYLDVFVEQTPSKFYTKVYTKPTNAGRCLNARGETSDAYKRSVISA